MTWLSSKDPAACAGRCWTRGCRSPGPYAGPRDLTIPKHSPYRLFFNVPYSFGLQPSYMLGYCWLFTLFLRRSARCSTCSQGEVGSAPTYLTAIIKNISADFFYKELFGNHFHVCGAYDLCHDCLSLRSYGESTCRHYVNK